MEPDDARSLYGTRYAGLYDQLWEESPLWAPEARLHVDALRDCLGPGARWLDVGCGTGWILSQFPGRERAGVDLSPAMLAHARSANPDALFFREGDIRDDVPEWFGTWDLVSTTGQPWGYVESIQDIARIAENMARWTSPTGTLFVQPPDIFDLTGLVIPYNFTGETPSSNSLAITAAIWSYYDEGGVHQDQIWPSLDVWVRWLSKWFRTIEVHTWPKEPDFLQGGRRLVLARDKRGPGDLRPAEITILPGPDDPGAAPEVLTSVVPPVPLQPGATSPRLADRPLSEILPRLAPWRPEMWRAVRSRIRRLRRGR